MATICPTVTAETPQEFSQQLARIKLFAPRVHIDLADGELAPRKLLDPAQVYLPKETVTDIHVMYAQPAAQLMTLMSLRPHLVILHAEARDEIAPLLRELQKLNIKAGVALLPQTSVQSAEELIAIADHVLIFAGHLGYQGGTADMSQVEKIPRVRAINPTVEIGWDGGINDQNAAELAQNGVDVLNVGGFIHEADDSPAAFKILVDRTQPQ